MAVDSTGAIVQSPKETWGVTKRDSVRWRVPASQLAPLFGVCASRCPAAVLSSDGDAINSPLAEDPAPLAVGGGILPPPLIGRTGGKSVILYTDGQNALRLGSDSDGDMAWTVVSARGKRISPAKNTYVDWFPTNDHSAALSSIDTARGREQRVWVKGRGGWSPVGKTGLTKSGFGCVGANAAHWVNDSRTLSSASGDHALPEAVALSNCGFTRNRLVVMSYTMRGDGPSSKMYVFTLTGKLRKTRVFDSEMALATDVRGSRFVLVGGGQATVFGADGAEVRRLSSVQDARFDETGAIVTLNRAGSVRWRTP